MVDLKCDDSGELYLQSKQRLKISHVSLFEELHLFSWFLILLSY